MRNGGRPRLREIIALAYEKTDFYRSAFNSVGFLPGDLRTVDDMGKLPTTDKKVVMDNIQRMLARSVKASDVDFVSTGGSSQSQLQFYMNANRSATEYAYLAATWARAGYKLGMPMAVFRGRVVQPDREGMHYEYDPIMRHNYYSSFHMTDADVRKYLESIGKLGPCWLHAYPSTACTLARSVLEQRQRGPENIRGVLLESENVYPDQEQIIEKAFDARILSSYGHTEKLVLAAQCEHTRDYHVWPTYGYLELLDEHGAPVRKVGDVGEIVGTGFINDVMPFIRYRTGDWATYGGERCDVCGRDHTILKDINGRDSRNGLIARDGSVISLSAMIVHDDTFRNVREYQFHQSEPGKATLCVVPAVPLDGNEQQRILIAIGGRLQEQIKIDISVRTALAKTARGKQPRVWRGPLTQTS
jgi:phenylacetate-CoA ligase